MDQEKIGNFIRNIRKKSGLTQREFALRYGVTYQAVSKWENAKNIPDISILKEMCREYNVDLNDLLDGNVNNIAKRKIRNKISLVVVVVLILVFGLLWFLNGNNTDFSFGKLSSTCDNFKLYGSMAYNDSKTSIYISDITYCGSEDDNLYKEIECTLYENDGDTKRVVSSYSYDEDDFISLDDFLDNVSFNVEHYSSSCKMYEENGLYLEIKAINSELQTIFYNIPLKLEENCND